MSKLLIDEYPLILLKSLGRRGLSAVEAAIVQQVHYWNEVNKKAGRNRHEGVHWTYNTYEKWADELVFWSMETIKRAITSLEKKGLIISGNFNEMKMDRTKWYRVNYEAVESLKLVSGIARVNMTSASGQNDPMGEVDPDMPVDHPSWPAMKIKYANRTAKA